MIYTSNSFLVQDENGVTVAEMRGRSPKESNMMACRIADLLTAMDWLIYRAPAALPEQPIDGGGESGSDA